MDFGAQGLERECLGVWGTQRWEAGGEEQRSGAERAAPPSLTHLPVYSAASPFVQLTAGSPMKPCLGGM